MASSQPPGPAHKPPHPTASPPERWQSPWSLDDEWSKHPPRILSDTRPAEQPVTVPPARLPLQQLIAQPTPPPALQQQPAASSTALVAHPQPIAADEELLARTVATPRRPHQTTISPKRAIPLRREVPSSQPVEPLPPAEISLQVAQQTPKATSQVQTQKLPLVEPLSSTILPPVQQPTAPLTPSNLGTRSSRQPPADTPQFMHDYRPGFSPALTGSVTNPSQPLAKKVRYYPDVERDLDDIRRAVRKGWAEQSFVWVIMFALVTLGFMLAAWIYIMDGPEPEDSDIVNQQRLTYSGLPPRALLSFKDLISNTSDFPYDVILPNEDTQLWPMWNFSTPDLSKLVTHYENTAAALRTLLAETDWQPQHFAWQKSEIASSAQLRILGLARCSAAIYHARKQEHDAALQACLDLAQLSARMYKLGLWPQFLQRSFELQHRSSSTICEVLRLIEKPDTHLISRFQREHEPLVMSGKELGLWLDQSYHRERHFLIGANADEPLDELTAAMLNQRPNRLFFKPNLTLEFFTQCFREMKQNSQLAAYLHQENRVKELGPHYQPKTWAYSSNVLGVRYANERIWPYITLVREHSLSLARHRLTQVAFALKRFQVDNGRFANDLQALVPRYFTALPADPFSPETLGYDPGKGVIYSLGTDLTSTGGTKDGIHFSHPEEPTVLLR